MSALNDAIERVARIVEISAEDHEAFMSDTHKIANAIHGEMEKRDCLFQNMFHDLYKTAQYRKGNFFDIPHEFASHLMFEIPFDDVEIVFKEPHFVQFKTNRDHLLTYEGYVDAFMFLMLFHKTLKKVIKKLPFIVCDGQRTYALSLSADMFGGIYDWQRIIAKEQFCTDGHPGEIIFEFFPVIKMSWNPKCAVCVKSNLKTYWTYICPFPDVIHKRSRFYRLMPAYQMMTEADWPKARRAVILVYALILNGDLSKISPLIETFLFKNVYFDLLQELGIAYMRRITLDTTFFELLWKAKTHVGFYDFPEQPQVFGKLIEICMKFVCLKDNNSIEINDILNWFGLA